MERDVVSMHLSATMCSHFVFSHISFGCDHTREKKHGFFDEAETIWRVICYCVYRFRCGDVLHVFPLINIIFTF